MRMKKEDGTVYAGEFGSHATSHTYQDFVVPIIYLLQARSILIDEHLSDRDKLNRAGSLFAMAFNAQAGFWPPILRNKAECFMQIFNGNSPIEIDDVQTRKAVLRELDVLVRDCCRIESAQPTA